METNATQTTILEVVAGDNAGVVEQLRGYGDLFADGLYLIVIGLLLVYLLHRFASKFIYRHIENRRFVRVCFGFLYALVLLTTTLLAMERIGLDVEVLTRVSFLLLCLGAVLAYFLAPFFPRLPFALGHMVEIQGELGVVDAISHIHTTIRKLDGTMVFIPNPSLLASKVKNFSDTPTRRVELALSVNNDCDLKETMDLFIRLMEDDERVLEEPAPPSVFVVNANASGVDLVVYCWVKNADWFRTRSDLWLKLVDTFLHDERLAMSLPQQEVFVVEGKGASRRGT